VLYGLWSISVDCMARVFSASIAAALVSITFRLARGAHGLVDSLVFFERGAHSLVDRFVRFKGSVTILLQPFQLSFEEVYRLRGSVELGLLSCVVGLQQIHLSARRGREWQPVGHHGEPERQRERGGGEQQRQHCHRRQQLVATGRRRCGFRLFRLPDGARLARRASTLARSSRVHDGLRCRCTTAPAERISAMRSCRGSSPSRAASMCARLTWPRFEFLGTCGGR
jgi:hypothetical protein